MRPVAKRTSGVVALAVVLFVGIAGQAVAGASESKDGCKVTYGGWISTAEGDKATFGGNAHSKGPKGQEEYQDHGPVTDINVHSIDVQFVTCGDGGVGVGVASRVATQASSSDAQTASVFGTATINGGGSFDYEIDLVDAGEPGTADTYRIVLSNGYDSGVQTLYGGNVQIHS